MMANIDLPGGGILSEYQYYEFLALDRPLTRDEMRELRSLSSRAEITATRFTNHYEWGDFKGDPDRLIERMFDAFVYVTNWGMRRFLLRLPARQFDVTRLRQYLIEPGPLSFRVAGESVIVEFLVEEEPFDEVDGGTGWISALTPLRADLLRGDWRSLYVGWLAGAQWTDDYDDEEEEAQEEPPLPAGLGELTAPLRALVDFLVLDEDWLAAAAEASPAAPNQQESTLNKREVQAWIARWPAKEKDRALWRVYSGEAHLVERELQQRIREALVPAAGQDDAAVRKPRTIAELRDAASRQDELRTRQEAERAKRECEERDRIEAEALEIRLRALAGREEQAWRKIEDLIQITRAAEYAQAAEMVGDLRRLAERTGLTSMFLERLKRVHAVYPTRRAFWERLRKLGIG